MNANSLDAVLNDFLAQITVPNKNDAAKLGPTTLGGEQREIIKITKSQRESLILGLEAARKSNRTIILLRLGLIVAVLCIVSGLTLYHRDNVVFISGSYMSGGAAVWLLMRQISDLHRRSVATDVLIAMLPNLALAEWPTVVAALLDEIRLPEFKRERTTTSKAARSRSA